MLTNLLPGLREIRAPLISGYLWLIFFFLAFHGDLPHRGDAPAVLRPLFSLGHELSSFGIATVSGVGAYLVGSAVQELLKLVARLGPGKPLYGEAGTHLSPAGRVDVHRSVGFRIEGIRRKLFEVALSPGERGVDQEPTPAAVERELPLIRTLLLGEHPDLVDELDRLQAEADLRITVAVPLVFLAVFLCLEISIGWLLVLLPAALLLAQGYQRQVEVGDLLAKALRIGKVSSPSLQFLDASAAAAVERTELEEELARKVSDGHSPMAAFRLGNLQASGENFEGALVSLRFAAENGVVQAFAELGYVYEQIEKFEDAEQAYRDGEKRNDKRAAQRLASLLRRLEREEEALEAVEGLEGEDEGDLLMEVSAGRVRTKIGDYRKRLEHGDAKAGINLGLLLTRQEDWNGAIDAYRRAASINPEDSQAWLSLGDALMRVLRIAEAEEPLVRALRIREKQAGGDHLGVADVLSTLGGVAGWKGQFDKAREMLNKALSIQERELGHENLQVAGTVRSLAASAFDSGAWKEAKALLERSLEVMERELGADHPRVATVLSELAYCDSSLGGYGEAQKMLDRALAIHEGEPGVYRLDLAKTLIAIGIQEQTLGAFERAGRNLEWALEIRLSALGEGHLSVARARSFFAESLRTLGRQEKAIVEHEAALTVLEANRKPDQSFVLPLSLASRSMRQGGRSDEAVSLSGKALRMAEGAGTYQPLLVAAALVDNAEALNAKRSFEGARDQARHALSLQSETIGTRHLYVAHTYMALGRSARGRRHLPQAREAFEKALEAIRSASVQHLPLYGEALRELAVVASRQGADEEAERLAHESVVSLEVGLGRDHPQLSISKDLLSSTLEKGKEPVGDVQDQR